MANFFSGLWKAATHPVDELKFFKDVITGDTKLKDAPGAHQRMMNDITVPILGDNKLSKNSDAVAGAIVAGWMAAPYIAGAAGGGAGGGAAGAAGTTAGTSAGTTAATSYIPSTAFGAGELGTAGSAFGWQGSTAGLSSSTGLTSTGMTTLGPTAGSAGGSTIGGMGIETAYIPTTEFGETASAAGMESAPWYKDPKIMQSIAQGMQSAGAGQNDGQNQIKAPPASRGSFSGVKNSNPTNDMVQQGLNSTPKYAGRGKDTRSIKDILGLR